MPGKPFTLSSFQVDKLTTYFNFYAPNEHNCLDDTSLDKFMKRVLSYTKWDPNSRDAYELYQVHEAFFEILFEKTDHTNVHSVSLEDWLSMWERLLPGVKGVRNFPVWLRLLPKALFNMMDRDKDLDINEEELCTFYQEMANLPEADAKANSHLAWSQMTDNGCYRLDMDGYCQIFSNFLLGRTPHGPGRHIFGCFEHRVDTTPFTLIQPAPEADDENSEVTIKKVAVLNKPRRMKCA